MWQKSGKKKKVLVVVFLSPKLHFYTQGHISSRFHFIRAITQPRPTAFQNISQGYETEPKQICFCAKVTETTFTENKQVNFVFKGFLREN